MVPPLMRMSPLESRPSASWPVALRMVRVPPVMVMQGRASSLSSAAAPALSGADALSLPWERSSPSGRCRSVSSPAASALSVSARTVSALTVSTPAGSALTVPARSKVPVSALVRPMPP